MLNKEELLTYEGEYTKYQVEKDYLQHVVLFHIYRNVTNELVFNGGTALQKAYALNRFSEDLDFDINTARSENEDILGRIEKGLNSINNFYKSEYKKEKMENSIKYKLKIEGPLFEKPRSIQTILLEISIRERPIEKPDTTLITPVFRDLSPYFIIIMNINEILAEKVRALMTRRKPRDLYDLYFLLHKGAIVNRALINRKLELYEKRFLEKEFVSSINSLEDVWEKELSILMRRIPEFKEIKDYVIERFA